MKNFFIFLVFLFSTPFVNASSKIDTNGRSWVMSNFVIGQKWESKYWKKKFGKWEEIPVKTGNSKIIKNYYFPSLDMTISVNTFKNETITWSSGRNGL